MNTTLQTTNLDFDFAELEAISHCVLMPDDIEDSISRVQLRALLIDGDDDYLFENDIDRATDRAEALNNYYDEVNELYDLVGDFNMVNFEHNESTKIVEVVVDEDKTKSLLKNGTLLKIYTIVIHD